MPATKPVKCPACGRVIGDEVQAADGMRFLRMGVITIFEYHGVCECGKELHWSIKMQKVLVYFRMMTGRDVAEEEIVHVHVP